MGREVRRVARERASEEHSIREMGTQAATLSRKLHNTKAKLEEELKRDAAERVKNIQRLGAAKAALAHTLKALQQEKKEEAEGKDQNEKLLQNLKQQEATRREETKKVQNEKAKVAR